MNSARETFASQGFVITSPHIVFAFAIFIYHDRQISKFDNSSQTTKSMRLPARNLTLLVNALAHLTTISDSQSRSKTRSQQWVHTAVESLLQVPLGGFFSTRCVSWLIGVVGVFFATKIFVSLFWIIIFVGATYFFTPRETNMLAKIGVRKESGCR